MLLSFVSVSIFTEPVAGTVTLYHKSPPEYPAHPGSPNPESVTVPSIVTNVLVHVAPTDKSIAPLQASFDGADVNTSVAHKLKEPKASLPSSQTLT